MLLICFQALDLDHEGAQFEKVELILDLVKSVASVVLPYLVEDLVDQIVVCIVQYVNHVGLDGF